MDQTVRSIGELARGCLKQFAGDEDRRAGGSRLRPDGQGPDGRRAIMAA
jgi:hypothetical protein